MKKVFTFMASCLMVLGASAQSYELRTLTFEDSDYVGDETNYLGHQTDFWSSLIDSPQYGGTLLYGENHGDTTKVYTATNYEWYDKGNTYLYSELPENWGTKMYWGGGHAISNYWNGNLSDGNFMNQLAVYTPNQVGSGQGGHGYNGSDNFCVHYGYHDNSGYSADNLPFFCFKDSVERIINGMYVNITTYLANCITNGNGLTSKLGAKDTIKIVATAYKLDGTTTTTEFELATSSKVTTDWSYWSLAKLGKVYKIEFNMVGTNDNGYGFSQPAYFCYDNVVVRMPMTNTSRSTENKVKKTEQETKTMTILCDDGWEPNILQGDVPEGVSYDYKSALDWVYGFPDAEQAPGSDESITIHNMPNDITITGIDAAVWGHSMMSSAITATMNGVEFGKLEFTGDDLYQTTESECVFPFELTPTTCNGDFKITFECFTKWAEIHWYKVHYTTGTTTGINEFGTIESASEQLYTLQGTRVKTPVKGQVYVKNGRKVVF